jgi:VWFA-related protein
MKHLRRFGWAAALVLTALGPAPVVAQEAAPEPPPPLFGEEIDVRVVNVEAVVTDRRGVRVTGLGPGDFRLVVDGEEVPVEFFTEVHGGQAVARAEAEAAGEAPAPVQGLPSLAPGSPVGTSYLLFIDDYFALAARRNEVLRGLKEELSRLGPEDRMAVVAFDGGRPTMLSSWSSSANTLSRALDEAMLRPSHGAARLAEIRLFDSTRNLVPGSSPPGLSGSRAAFSQRLDIDELSFAEQVSGQVERAVNAAVVTLRSFAAPPGRKVMLLLSGGWPMSPAEYVINNPERPILDRRLLKGDDLVRPLVETANRLGYTVYPVDVPGLQAGGGTAEFSRPTVAGIDLREQEVHATLEHVAERTGGRALLNSARLEALDVVESDTRSYYWLGFTPRWQGDDASHTVKVEVARPGLQVRTRDSFLDLSRETERTMMVESAMLFGNSPSSVPMPVQVGTPERAGRREMEVPISLGIPIQAITLVPLGEEWVAELELRVVAVDVRGQRSEIVGLPVQIRLKEKPEKEGFLRYDTRLKLRRIAQSLVVTLFDPVGGAILAAEAEVAPAK